MGENSSADTLLEQKARLLLSREREVYELRLQRTRAECWLNAVHSLHPDVARCDIDALLSGMLDQLVADLSFEIAAAFELEVDGGMRVALCDPTELPAGLVVEESVVRALLERPDGSAEPGADGALAGLGRRLGMVRLRWSSKRTARGTTFLILAGFSPRTAQFHRFSADDETHMTMFCSHGVALLNNILLLSNLHDERRDLEATNQELDTSLGKLRETQAQLMESTRLVARASWEAGMAEVATGILHNVGNVLNSVNVCADVAGERVEQLPVRELRRCADLLREQPDLGEFFQSDPRASKLLPYLLTSVEVMERTQSGLKQELTELRRHLGHVSTIISRQQAYAKGSVVEPCDLAMLTEDALLLARPVRTERGVRVLREFANVEPVQVDKHRVLQILVNLITNAVQSLSAAEVEDKQLVARLRTDQHRVLLEIADNGVGISAEDAPRIFQHGFTTRRNGHGFGLHTSALTAKELGGELSFYSEGPGTGATFTLSLPASAARS